MRYLLLPAAAFVFAACGGTRTPPAPDSAAVARQVADSTMAAHTGSAAGLEQEARAVMPEALTNPKTATFDSMTVTQPASTNGAWPAPVVCGRIGGRPGIKGAKGMTPFIYENRATVFVLDRSNGVAFAQLRAKLCDGSGVRILLR